MSQVVELQSGAVSGSLAQVAEFGLSPIQSTGSALSVGKLKVTADLYAAFADTSADDKRVNVVFSAAALEGFTCEDLNSNLKAACKMADEADIREGFSAPVGAKGQDKYGPRRSSMNARASEIRQLFGALTNGADIQANAGWVTCVKQARVALKEAGLTWEGLKAPTNEEKAAKAETALGKQVREEWMANHPQNVGESIRQYTERMLEACEILVVEAQQAADAMALQKLADKLVEKHGINMCGDLAFLLADMFNKHVEQQAEAEGHGPEVVM